MVVVKMHVVILEPPVSSLIKKHATVSNMKTYLRVKNIFFNVIIMVLVILLAVFV
jgi:TRAP-type C4-dicarboxylate transport system permease large subunit